MGLVEGAWQVCNERAASRTREAALMKRVSFHELAERELNDAALYYEQETPASASNSWRKLSDTSAQSSKLRTPVRGYAGGCGGGSCVHFLMRSYTRLSPSRRFEICTLRMQARYRYSTPNTATPG